MSKGQPLREGRSDNKMMLPLMHLHLEVKFLHTSLIDNKIGRVSIQTLTNGGVTIDYYYQGATCCKLTAA